MHGQIGVYGWVYNNQTLETIPGAIAIDSASHEFTEATQQGYYQLAARKGLRTYIFVAAGFKPKVLQLDIDNPKSQNVFLDPTPRGVSDSSALYLSLYDAQVSTFKPLKRQVTDAPTLLSLTDPVKYLQFLPGVSGGIEGLSGMYVRGSNADQSLFLMNGLPVYGNGHVWGLLSNYNPEISKSTVLYRGVAPARFGGRAGGAVMDVTTQGGTANELKGSFQIDPLAFNLSLEGPLDVTGRTTFATSIRRSYLDWLFDFNAGEGLGAVVNMHDFNAKVDFKQDQYTQWSFWVYNGRDKYQLSTETQDQDSLGRRQDISLLVGVNWQNTLAGVSCSHIFNYRHFATFSAGMSRYRFRSPIEIRIVTDSGGFNQQTSQLAYTTEHSITDFSAQADFSYLLDNNSRIRYGTHWVAHNMKPGLEYLGVQANGNPFQDTLYGVENAQVPVEISHYGEWELHPNIGLSINVGLRSWTYISGTNFYSRLEPRFLLSQMMEGQKRFQLAAGISNQGIHQMSSMVGILPRDMWFPTSGNFKPQQTLQASIGYRQPLGSRFEISAEGFIKRFNGITDLTGTPSDALKPNFWDEAIAQGQGSARGLELLVSKSSGKVTGLASYTFSRTERTFASVNEGQAYPFRWDRPHKASAQLTWYIWPTFRMNASAMFMSGNLVTVPSSRYVTVDGSLVYDYSQKNNYRLPAYRRIDLGFTKEIHPEIKRSYHELYGIQVYNIMGWNNPIFTRLEIVDGSPQLMGISLFTFVPSIFYRIEF
ncbi:MAG: TonB-dependent receptor plug domain-containing protein [Bacteroidia bacterium]